MNNLETEIVTVSEEEFENLDGKLPAGTPKPSNLNNSFKPAADENGEEIVIPNQDIEVLSDEEEQRLTDPKGKGKPKDKNTPPNPLEDKDKQEDKDKDKGKGKENTEQVDDDEQDSEVNFEAGTAKQQMTLHLIESGIWKDFDGREELKPEDFTDDFFSKLVEKQDEERVNNKFEDLIDSTGTEGKLIIEHILSGGNPKEVIDLFVKNREIQQLDVKTPEGQESIMRNYYKSLGWEGSKIDKQIKLLIDGNSLQEFAEDVQKLSEKDTKKQAEAKIKAAQKEKELERENQEKFEKGVFDVISKRQDLDKKEKQELVNNLLSFNYKLEDGTLVNQFYIDFMKMQQNLEDYIELALFVKNKQNYISKISKKEEAKATKRTWDFVKGNGAVSNKTAGNFPDRGAKNNNDLVIKYK